jgi:hypothetical protein
MGAVSLRPWSREVSKPSWKSTKCSKISDVMRLYFLMKIDATHPPLTFLAMAMTFILYMRVVNVKFLRVTVLRGDLA